MKITLLHPVIMNSSVVKCDTRVKEKNEKKRFTNLIEFVSNDTKNNVINISFCNNKNKQQFTLSLFFFLFLFYSGNLNVSILTFNSI